MSTVDQANSTLGGFAAISGAMSAVAAPLAIASTIFSAVSASKAKRRLKRANKFQTAIDNIQTAAKRAQQAENIRMTIAAQLASDIGSGAGFESSRTQGQFASTVTQGRRAQAGFDIATLYGQKANRARAKAGQAITQGQVGEALSGAFSMASDLIAKV